MREGSEFTSQRWLDELLPEVDSARSVLASADRLLRQDGPLDNAPVWATAIRTLRGYADAARHDNLDQVSGKEVSSRTLRLMWNDAERAPIPSSSSLVAQNQRTIEGEKYARFERELRVEVAEGWCSIAMAHTRELRL